MTRSDQLLQGTLDLLILKVLKLGPMHGLAVADRIRQLSVDVLCVNQSALYPALHRLEHQAWITATWGDSQNNRRAKFYPLYKSGSRAAQSGRVLLGPSFVCSSGCASLRLERASCDLSTAFVTVCILFFIVMPQMLSWQRSCVSTLKVSSNAIAHRECRRRKHGQRRVQISGSLTEATQLTYESRGIAMAEDCAQDLRYTLRSFRRQPGFAGVVVFTLALGIAACTARIPLVNAVLLRSLPYGDANRLVYLYTPNPSLKEVPPEAFGPTIADFLDIQAQARSYSSLTMFDQKPMNLITGNEPERVGVARVDAGFFRNLGGFPLAGPRIQPRRS